MVDSYNSVPLQTATRYDLSGGMVSSYNFAVYKLNQFLRGLNGDLFSDGSFQTRKGRAKLNSVALSNNATVRHLTKLGQTSGADFILGAAGTILYEISSGVNSIVKTGLNANAFLSDATIDDFLFFCNGVDVPFMTQGMAGSTYQVGITPPNSLLNFLVAAIAGGDGTVGSHRVSFRYRSTITGARSNPYILNEQIQFTSVTLTLGNQTYEITFPVNLVSPDPQVDIIDYFVQEANAVQDSSYYYLGSSPNVAGVYAFGLNVSDELLVLKERLDIDDYLPLVSSRGFEVYRNRILAIVDDYTVQYSKQRFDANSFLNLPTSFPPEQALTVGFGDGDPLVRVMVAGNYAFAFKRNSIWILVGDFNTGDFGFQKLKTNYTNVGLLNPRAVVQAGDKVFFVTDDLKFMFFRPTEVSLEELRLPVIPPSDRVNDLFVSFAAPYRDNVNLVNFTFGPYTQIWAAFSDGGSGFLSNQNFNVFVFDYTKDNGDGAWHIHTALEVVSSVLARDANRDYYVFSGDYYGYVWKQAFGTGDGALINGTSSGGNDATSLKDNTQIFTPALVGTFVSIIDGFGVDQIRRVVAVPNINELTVAPPWFDIPNNTSKYTVGGIDFELWSRHDWLTPDAPPDFDKYGWYLDLDVEVGGTFSFDVYLLKDRASSLDGAIKKTITTEGGSNWNFAYYNLNYWNETSKQFPQIGFDLLFKQISHRIINKQAGQPMKINGWTYSYQLLGKVRYT